MSKDFKLRHDDHDDVLPFNIWNTEPPPSYENNQRILFLTYGPSILPYTVKNFAARSLIAALQVSEKRPGIATPEELQHV